MSYSQSQSQSGQGSKLEVCLFADSPIVWQDVGELKGWSPSGEWEIKDPTNLQSLSREKKPVLNNAGAVSTSVNRVATNTGQLLLQTAYLTNPTPLLRLRFTLPIAVEAGQTTTGDEYLYSGYCTQFEPDVVGAGEIVGNKFKVELTARLGFTAGS